MPTDPTLTPSSPVRMNRSAVLEFLETRRSPKLRSLAEPAPSADALRRMLAVASRVPDHGKLVPWRFVVIEGERKDTLNEFLGRCFDDDHPGATELERQDARQRLAFSPLLVAVVYSPKPHPKIPAWEQTLTAGAVCMNLLNAVRSMGFAGVWLTQWFAYDRRVLDELGLEENEQIAGYIHIGTETEAREDRSRPDLDEIVSAY